MNIFDKDGVLLIDGSIINIGQTVNGQSQFIVLTVNPLDIRYLFDISYKYEYNKMELITPDKFSDQIEFEIIGNINS